VRMRTSRTGGHRAANAIGEIGKTLERSVAEIRAPAVILEDSVSVEVCIASRFAEPVEILTCCDTAGNSEASTTPVHCCPVHLTCRETKRYARKETAGWHRPICQPAWARSGHSWGGGQRGRRLRLDLFASESDARRPGGGAARVSVSVGRRRPGHLARSLTSSVQVFVFVLLSLTTIQRRS
jgi:hypothetical protein